jgi:quercetin dioxygenase-like cupin family protein
MRNEQLYGRVVSIDELPEESPREGVVRRSYSTDEVMLVMNELTPGMTLNPHVHETFDQLAYILKGEADYYIGDTAHPMRAGDLLLIPTGAPHHINPKPTGEMVLNLDIFVPPRADLSHLLEWLSR